MVEIKGEAILTIELSHESRREVAEDIIGVFAEISCCTVGIDRIFVHLEILKFDGEYPPPGLDNVIVRPQVETQILGGVVASCREDCHQNGQHSQ